MALLGWLSISGVCHADTHDDWAQAHNLSGASSGPTNAPAGDGIPNLLKFLWALRP